MVIKFANYLQLGDYYFLNLYSFIFYKEIFTVSH